jgi:hypothetical protein
VAFSHWDILLMTHGRSSNQFRSTSRSVGTESDVVSLYSSKERNASIEPGQKIGLARRIIDEGCDTGKVQKD